MKPEVTDYQTMKRFLLGRLDEEHMRQVEQRLLTEHQFFGELSIAEDELIDDYLAGMLTEEERELFENHFLRTPERNKRLGFAKVFRRYVDEERKADPASMTSPGGGRWITSFIRMQRPGLVLPLAFAMLLVMVGGAWVVAEIRRLHILLNQERVQRTELEKELVTSRQQPDSNKSEYTFSSTVLTPGLVRGGGEMPRITVPDGVDILQIRLETTADDYQKYQAILQTDEGKVIFIGNNLSAESVTPPGKAVILSLPTHLLVPKEYQLKLNGLSGGGAAEEIARYYFRVTKH